MEGSNLNPLINPHGTPGQFNINSKNPVLIDENEVKVAAPGQDMIYPNLNSCISITATLKDGTKVGSHFVVFGQTISCIQGMKKIINEKNQPVKNLLIAGSFGPPWTSEMEGKCYLLPNLTTKLKLIPPMDWPKEPTREQERIAAQDLGRAIGVYFDCPNTYTLSADNIDLQIGDLQFGKEGKIEGGLKAFNFISTKQTCKGGEKKLSTPSPVFDKIMPFNELKESIKFEDQK